MGGLELEARAGAPRRWLSVLAVVHLALPIALVLGTATLLALKHPIPVADGSISAGPERRRFGRTERERRDLFARLCDGEPHDRAEVEKDYTETEIWNRNHDSFFHQREWPRLVWVARVNGIEFWQAWLILDEGLHNHWPPAPGVEVKADGPPLARYTAPLDRKRVIVATPRPPSPIGASPSPVVHVTRTRTIPRP